MAAIGGQGNDNSVITLNGTFEIIVKKNLTIKASSLIIFIL